VTEPAFPKRISFDDLAQRALERRQQEQSTFQAYVPNSDAELDDALAKAASSDEVQAIVKQHLIQRGEIHQPRYGDLDNVVNPFLQPTGIAPASAKDATGLSSTPSASLTEAVETITDANLFIETVKGIRRLEGDVQVGATAPSLNDSPIIWDANDPFEQIMYPQGNVRVAVSGKNLQELNERAAKVRAHFNPAPISIFGR
jgi:hypothetical protein